MTTAALKIKYIYYATKRVLPTKVLSYLLFTLTSMPHDILSSQLKIFLLLIPIYSIYDKNKEYKLLYLSTYSRATKNYSEYIII